MRGALHTGQKIIFSSGVAKKRGSVVNAKLVVHVFVDIHQSESRDHPLVATVLL